MLTLEELGIETEPLQRFPTPGMPPRSQSMQLEACMQLSLSQLKLGSTDALHPCKLLLKESNVARLDKASIFHSMSLIMREKETASQERLFAIAVLRQQMTSGALIRIPLPPGITWLCQRHTVTAVLP